MDSYVSMTTFSVSVRVLLSVASLLFCAPKAFGLWLAGKQHCGMPLPCTGCKAPPHETELQFASFQLAVLRICTCWDHHTKSSLHAQAYAQFRYQQQERSSRA
jgi:hypothetical protein